MFSACPPSVDKGRVSTCPPIESVHPFLNRTLEKFRAFAARIGFRAGRTQYGGRRKSRCESRDLRSYCCELCWRCRVKKCCTIFFYFFPLFKCELIFVKAITHLRHAVERSHPNSQQISFQRTLAARFQISFRSSISSHLVQSSVCSMRVTASLDTARRKGGFSC